MLKHWEIFGRIWSPWIKIMTEFVVFIYLLYLQLYFISIICLSVFERFIWTWNPLRHLFKFVCLVSLTSSWLNYLCKHIFGAWYYRTYLSSKLVTLFCYFVVSSLAKSVLQILQLNYLANNPIRGVCIQVYKNLEYKRI